MSNRQPGLAGQHASRLPRPVRDAFFLPRGLLGRVGVLMARGGNQQREIAELLADPGASLCELGCGPGVLATLLAQRHTRLRLHLVDPSPVMRSQAAHRCRRWLHGGRVSVCAGTAEHIPLPDAACDTVVAVNNVAMWTDLSAGLREIHRILRPGGRLLVTWHSATAPSSTQRRLALSDDGTRIVGEALKTTFGDVHHHRLAHSLVWTARRTSSARHNRCAAGSW